jgi:hypothetical protein
MKVEVRYRTEFGSQRQTMTLNELTRFIHRFHVIALYEVKEEPEVPVVTDWNDLKLVDTDIKFSEDGSEIVDYGDHGICISRDYLKENYPNGVIIKIE